MSCFNGTGMNAQCVVGKLHTGRRAPTPSTAPRDTHDTPTQPPTLASAGLHEVEHTAMPSLQPQLALRLGLERSNQAVIVPSGEEVGRGGSVYMCVYVSGAHGCTCVLWLVQRSQVG